MCYIQNLIKLCDAVVLYEYYNFSKFYQILMKNKKVIYRTLLTDGLSIIGAGTIYLLFQALERFLPEERDCYKEQEIDLMYLPKSHGYRYEMSNCLFEAAYEKILEECHCAPG